jgi:hypothetical protein
MPGGKQADLLFADSKADIRRLVNIGLAAQQFAEKALCPTRVFDWIDNRSDTMIHELKSPFLIE